MYTFIYVYMYTYRGFDICPRKICNFLNKYLLRLKIIRYNFTRDKEFTTQSYIIFVENNEPFYKHLSKNNDKREF